MAGRDVGRYQVLTTYFLNITMAPRVDGMPRRAQGSGFSSDPFFLETSMGHFLVQRPKLMAWLGSVPSSGQFFLLIPIGQILGTAPKRDGVPGSAGRGMG